MDPKKNPSAKVKENSDPKNGAAKKEKDKVGANDEATGKKAEENMDVEKELQKTDPEKTTPAKKAGAGEKNIPQIYEDGEEVMSKIGSSPEPLPLPLELRDKKYKILFICAFVAAIVIIGLNIILIIISGVQKNLDLYYFIAGCPHIYAICAILMFLFLISGFLSSLVVSWNFAPSQFLQKANLISVSALASIGYAVGLAVWCPVILQPLSKLPDLMMDTLKHRYVSEFSWDYYSVAWNFIQLSEKSCGVNAPEDWTASDWSNRTDFSDPIFCCSDLDDEHLEEEILDRDYMCTDEVDRLRYQCQWQKRRAEIENERVTAPTTLTSETTGSENFLFVDEIEIEETTTPSTTTIQSITTTTTTTEVKFERKTTFKSNRDFKRLQNDTGLRPYSEKSWTDLMGSIEADFFEPEILQETGKNLRWYEANEYCKYFYSYNYPEAEVTENPAGIAIGFNTDEITQLVFLLNSTEDQFLGIRRESGPAGSHMLVEAYPSISLPGSMNVYLKWLPGAPNEQLRYGNEQLRYGCLRVVDGMRDVCSDHEQLRSVCASYEVVSRKVELKYINGIYYEYMITENILGRYFVVNIAMPFVDAVQRCPKIYGSDWFLAFGSTGEEVDVLSEIGVRASFPESYMHLNMIKAVELLPHLASTAQPFSDLSFFEFLFWPLMYFFDDPVKPLRLFTTFDEIPTRGQQERMTFGPLWESGYPSSAGECETNPGYGFIKSYARADDCGSDTERPFICAKYKKTPGPDPFGKGLSPKIELPAHYPNGFRVVRPNLGAGIKDIVEANNESSWASLVFDWKSAFNKVKARYYIPKSEDKTFNEANKFCSDMIKKTQPNREYYEHQPGLPVGFTTDEVEMLSNLEFYQQRNPYFGTPLRVVKEGKDEFRVKWYNLTLDLNGYFDGEKYELWAENEPELKNERYGCMINGTRATCAKDDQNVVICTNYTFSEDGFDTNSTKNIPEVMYELYVSEYILGEYWLVGKQMSHEDAVHYCAYNFGPGFTIPVGFNKQELVFLRSLTETPRFPKWPRVHLGMKLSPREEFYESTVFDLKFTTLWTRPLIPFNNIQFGCIRKRYETLLSGREPCFDIPRPFICALYEEIPHKIPEYRLPLEAEGQGSVETPKIAQTIPSYGTRSNPVLMSQPNMVGTLEVVRSKMTSFAVPATSLLFINFTLVLFILATSVVLFKLES